MKVETFGDPQKPVALLVHSIFYPGVTSYRRILPLLIDDYYVVIPNLEGLDYPHSDFVSARCQSDKIIEWMRGHNINKIAFLLGSSYGASVAFEILKDISIEIDKAALDAPAMKSSRIYGLRLYLEMKKTSNGFKKYPDEFLSKSKKYKYLTKEDEKYCIEVYKAIDNNSLKKIAFSCYDYTLPSRLYRTGTSIVFLFGEKDKAKINLPEIKSLGTGKIKIIDGMSHMQYMFESPKEFLKECGL
nr:alpha/beta hydrolase [uncultured Peptostreptococcus sp.]